MESLTNALKSKHLKVPKHWDPRFHYTCDRCNGEYKITMVESIMNPDRDSLIYRVCPLCQKVNDLSNMGWSITNSPVEVGKIVEEIKVIPFHPDFRIFASVDEDGSCNVAGPFVVTRNCKIHEIPDIRVRIQKNSMREIPPHRLFNLIFLYIKDSLKKKMRDHD